MIDNIISVIQNHPEITILGAVTLIQIAPIKFDPWTALARWLKKTIIGDVEKKLDDISGKVEDLDCKIGETEARNARRHILRFADELYNRTVKHSKEYFDDILDDIHDYEAYCDVHETFKNGKTGMAIDMIRKTYKDVYGEHKFL